MNRNYKTLIVCTLVALVSITTAFAGNRDRSGQAGAQHLLVDPWAKTNGWANAAVAEIRGLESIFANIAGMSFVEKTEFGFSHTRYLTGFHGTSSGLSLNSFAFAQSLYKRDKETKAKIKDYGVLGISFFSMSFGKIAITTVDQPEGGLGYYSPNLITIGVHYAKSFNDFIHGGVSVKIVNESVADVSSTGVAIDAGVQYLAGAYKNFKIGVALKNIGLPMRFKGDGLSVRASKNQDDYLVTLDARSEKYEIPTCLSIGVSYDFLVFGDEYKNWDKADKVAEGLTRDNAIHRITLAGSFTANSYSRDIFALGMEYGFMNYFMLRAGYSLEAGMFKAETRDTWYSGPSAGLTVAIPLTKKGSSNHSKLFFDYAYRFTYQWEGNHYIGIKLAL
jgi:hypothetical protein